MERKWLGERERERARVEEGEEEETDTPEEEGGESRVRGRTVSRAVGERAG